MLRDVSDELLIKAVLKVAMEPRLPENIVLAIRQAVDEIRYPEIKRMHPLEAFSKAVSLVEMYWWPEYFPVVSVELLRAHADPILFKAIMDYGPDAILSGRDSDDTRWQFSRVYEACVSDFRECVEYNRRIEKQSMVALETLIGSPNIETQQVLPAPAEVIEEKHITDGGSHGAKKKGDSGQPTLW
jgi:hypothetical protein